jgi:HlyD family secretion protein
LLLPALDPVVLHAQGEARVLSIGIVEGQEVKAGQTLLQMGNPPLEKTLSAARETLENLRSTDERLTAGENKLLERAERERKKKRVSLERMIRDTEKLLKLQGQQLEAERELLKEGLIPNQTWIQSQKELAQLNEQKLGSEAQLQEIVLTYQQTVEAIEEAREGRAIEILKAEEQVAEYSARSESYLDVVSPINGHVLELRINEYSQVSAGDDLVEILPLGGIANRCVAYTDATLGKKIRTGMRVLVSPSIAKPERYGYIAGEVVEVSEVISSKASMMDVFDDEIFVGEILQSYPAPLRIVVHLLPDTDTASGFKWTSASGLPGKISVGTICNLEVEVQRDRPINLFIPWLKKLVGVYG